ncbi:MAG: hypothetical protein P4L50_24275 [Anaerolineaceae bacterium]|nr:hypothetical protein [Anaerolineaceae bacterium]
MKRSLGLICISVLLLLCSSCASPLVPASTPTPVAGLASPTVQTAVEPAPDLAPVLSAIPTDAATAISTPSQTPTPDASLTAGWVNYQSTETTIMSSPTPPFSLDTLKGTPMVTSYPVKQPLLLYFSGEGHMGSIFDPFQVDVVTPRLYLYSDGLLLVGDEKGQILQKQLSQSEMKALLAKLRQLGFYQLQTNGQADPSDPLYHFGPGQYQQFTDASSTEIQTFGAAPRAIGIYEPLLPYVVQPLKNILAYLNHYRPAGLSPFQPDRLLAMVIPGHNPDLPDQPASLPWPADLPAPDQVSANGFLYLEGSSATTLYGLMSNHEYGVFTYQGNEYTVDALAPIFPNQCQNRAIDPATVSLPVYQQNFICQD